MRVDAFQQVLDAETLAADVLHLTLVLLVDGLHDKSHQHRTLAAQFLQVNLLRIVRTVHRLAVVDEVAHLHVEQQRLLGILHVERVKAAVLRDDAHVRLVLEVLHGRLHADHVLRTVRLARYQVGRAQIHIAHLCREDDVYGLVVRHLQPVGRNHAVEGQLLRQPVIQVAVRLLLRIDLLGQGRLSVTHVTFLHGLVLLRIGSYDAHREGKNHDCFSHFTLDFSGE